MALGATRPARLDTHADATTMSPATGAHAMDPTTEQAAPHARRPAIDPAHAARCVSPEVQRAIVSRLRAGGVAPADVPDVAQDVTLKLLVTRKAPADMPGCVALARHIAGETAIDVRRKHKRRGRSDTGPTDGADDHAAADTAADDADAALDRTRQLELIAEKRADGSLDAKAARMLELQAEGMSAPEIAREVGLAPQTVRNTLSAVKRELRAEWARRLGPVVGGVLLLLAAWRSAPQEPAWTAAEREEPEESSGTTGAAPGEAPQSPGKAPVFEWPGAREARAAELRLRARDECRGWALPACEHDLDEARSLDPAGEAAPEVQAMRRAIEEQWPLPR
jgi:DNA-directed RNA polymerase specialized sigma24 family protein